MVLSWFLISAFQVKLGEPGYKERYYCEKFELSDMNQIDEIKRDVVSPAKSWFTWYFMLRLPLYFFWGLGYWFIYCLDVSDALLSQNGVSSSICKFSYIYIFEWTSVFGVKWRQSVYWASRELCALGFWPGYVLPKSIYVELGLPRIARWK